MMHSVLENKEWTESKRVPEASNADRSFAAYAGPGGRMELAWGQNTMGNDLTGWVDGTSPGLVFFRFL